MLKRRLSIVQWFSLLILGGGVAIVQIVKKIKIIKKIKLSVNLENN